MLEDVPPSCTASREDDASGMASQSAELAVCVGVRELVPLAVKRGWL